ncbi:MAG: hypothetical protein J5J00_08090 [Deltaproteobacteria bacterium]|nr:hypothetical protein [Deltaproteobacteria bacterium]
MDRIIFSLLEMAQQTLLLAFNLILADAASESWYSPLLTAKGINQIKQVIAVTGMLVLTAQLMLYKSGAGEGSAKLRRGLDRALVVLAVLAFCSWFNFFQFHFGRFIHNWEFFHYYTGAKYFAELGYTELYNCSALAESEAGGELSGRKIRDLESNIIRDTSELGARINTCKDRFTEERWEVFRGDIQYFRQLLGPDRWARALYDHGFNATPVWIVAGSFLANQVPATDEGLELLGAIDLVLIGVMWCLAFWGFGVRAASIAIIFWGTNFLSPYYWTGGGFLRHDWLAFGLAGLALLKREKAFAAGAAITYSALLRLFPVFLIAGVIFKVLHAIRQGRGALPREEFRFLFGCAAALLVLLPLSVFTYKGDGNLWREFVANIEKHAATPLTNYMGLNTVLSYSQSERAAITRDDSLADPFLRFKESRLETSSDRKIVRALVQLVFVVLVFFAASRQPAWVSSILGMLLVPIFSELTNYYYSFLLMFAFLSSMRPSIGVELLTIAWLSFLVPQVWHMYDQGFTFMSLLVLLFILRQAFSLSFQRPPYKRESDGS